MLTGRYINNKGGLAVIELMNPNPNPNESYQYSLRKLLVAHDVLNG